MDDVSVRPLYKLDDHYAMDLDLGFKPHNARKNVCGFPLEHTMNKYMGDVCKNRDG
jgi:hypothetical protein